MKREGLWFLVVGTIGFVVDAGGLWLLNSILGMSPVEGRLCSIAIAICITYILNKSITFKATGQSVLKTFVPYVAANALSQSLNYVLYLGLIFVYTWFYEMPLAAMAISSITAMVVSFSLSKYWVFKNHDNLKS